MLKSVHPCTLFNVEFLLRKNVAAAYNPGYPYPSCLSSAFKNSGAGYKARAKNTRRRIFDTLRTVFCAATP